MLAKVAAGCETELDNCEEYLSCSGFGTKLNDLTRSKPLVTESDYFLEFTKVNLIPICLFDDNREIINSIINSSLGPFETLCKKVLQCGMRR